MSQIKVFYTKLSQFSHDKGKLESKTPTTCVGVSLLLELSKSSAFTLNQWRVMGVSPYHKTYIKCNSPIISSGFHTCTGIRKRIYSENEIPI